MTRPASLFDAALFARCLEACIAERRLSANRAAQEAGVNQATLSLALRCKSRPSLETFARLCRWMRVPIGLFFGEGQG